MSAKYLYLFINLGTLFFPFVFSFEKRVSYYTWWKYLFPALVITALVFLIWDYFFTKTGVWGFNEEYITGHYVLNIPIEEILFFFVIPFSSIFIYAFLNKLNPDTTFFDKIQKPLSWFIFIMAAILLILHFDKAYTALNSGYAFILLGLQLFLIKGNYMGKFYRFYLWHLIPFFIVNSILTGTWIESQVVWYNNDENLGIRMGTIPIEDSLYSLSLMLMNITLFEYFYKRKKIY